MTDSPNIPDLRYRIINWVGIIEQLTRNRATRVLAPMALTFPQFVILNHFSHRPTEAKTVTGMADALQQNQSAVTKTVQALLDAGLLSVQIDGKDRRVKWLYLTPAGARIHQQAVTAFSKELDTAFAGWDESTLQRLFADLDRLKVHFDENR